MCNEGIAIKGIAGKCEVCGALVGVKVVQIGANTCSLCEQCRDSLAKIISVDLLADRYEIEETKRPICNFCGRAGMIGERTREVGGYQILDSCHRCEYEILESDDEEDM